MGTGICALPWSHRADSGIISTMSFWESVGIFFFFLRLRSLLALDVSDSNTSLMKEQCWYCSQDVKELLLALTLHLLCWRIACSQAQNCYCFSVFGFIPLIYPRRLLLVLETRIDESNSKLRSKDEKISELEKVIQEKADTVASLNSKIEAVEVWLVSLIFIFAFLLRLVPL